MAHTTCTMLWTYTRRYACENFTRILACLLSETMEDIHGKQKLLPYALPAVLYENLIDSTGITLRKIFVSVGISESNIPIALSRLEMDSQSDTSYSQKKQRCVPEMKRLVIWRISAPCLKSWLFLQMTVSMLCRNKEVLE